MEQILCFGLVDYKNMPLCVLHKARFFTYEIVDLAYPGKSCLFPLHYNYYNGIYRGIMLGDFGLGCPSAARHFFLRTNQAIMIFLSIDRR